jgi:hypothetical protein
MYGKEVAGKLNEVWCLHKQKASKGEKDVDWWRNTLKEFNAIADSIEDEDEKSCISHYIVAALQDIEDKALNRTFHARYNIMNKDMTAQEFIEYLKRAERGDIANVEGKAIEILEAR